MEPANQSPVRRWPWQKAPASATVIEFLPDADEIERSPLPPLARRTVHLMFIAVFTFITWATFSDVDEVVVAHGRLVTPTPNIVLQPLEISLLQKIHVRVGQVVKKGEVLATLDPTFTNADQAQLQTRLKSLDTQVKALNDEVEGRPGSTTVAKDADGKLQSTLALERRANYRAQMAKMSEALERTRAALETNRRDQQILATRVKSLQEIETMQEKLAAQQFSSRAAFLQAQERRLEIERDLQQARNREAELKREIAAAEAERAAFGNSWRQKTLEDLLSTTRERDSINEQLQKADRRSRLVNVTAPVDAVVLEVAKLSEGSVAKEAEPLFTLVPLAAALEAEVQIDSVDVGQIKSGDEVRLKFDAYPFQKHGTLAAKVRTVSEDAFRRDAANAGGGTEAYYLSRISFGDAKLKKMSAKNRLLPGMTVAAEIVVGKRSVLSYLVWPLTKALDEAMHEP